MVTKKIKEKISFFNNIKYLNIKDYCISVVEKLNLHILSVETINNLIKENHTNDFFPEVINLNRLFSSTDIQFIVSYFFHFEDINNDFLILHQEAKNIKEINYDFLYKNNQLIFETINFQVKDLLSIDSPKSVDKFLFLYFLPIFKNNEFLYYKEIPIISFPTITIDNFKLLLYLMKNYDEFKFNSFKENKNLTHFLIEIFFSTPTSNQEKNILSMFFTISDSINKNNFQEDFLVDKLKLLFNEDMTIKNIQYFIDKHIYSLFESQILDYKYLELEFLTNKLKNELIANQEDCKINKI